MNKKTFYILNLTWGLPMNIIGSIAALWLICALKVKPVRHGGCWCFTYGKTWGGVSLGLVTIVHEGASKHTKDHEFGHSIQNAAYGPAMVILSIASAARYQWRKWMIKNRPGVKLAPYNAFWFEAQATAWGEKHIKNF